MLSHHFTDIYLSTNFGGRLQRLPRYTGRLEQGKHRLGKIILSIEFAP